MSNMSKKREKYRRQQRRTAYHEAGHVVACEELDVFYLSVSVDPNLRDGTAGRTAMGEGDEIDIPPGADPDDPRIVAAALRQAFTQAVVDYAGHAAMVAVLKQGRWTDRSARFHGAWSDFENAARCLLNDKARIDEARARALHIVTSRHDDVRRVAEALLKRGWLDLQHVGWVLSGRRVEDFPEPPPPVEDFPEPSRPARVRRRPSERGNR